MTNALRFIRLIATGMAALSMAPAAHAALGHAFESVTADRAHMAARMTSAEATNGLTSYTTHVLTLANGGLVKEFAKAGIVFAVTWQGPARPDLRQLLGEHFDTLQADNASPGRRHARVALSVNRSDFVVQSGGHSGAFWGLAYLPGIAPAGVSASDLH